MRPRSGGDILWYLSDQTQHIPVSKKFERQTGKRIFLLCPVKKKMPDINQQYDAFQRASPESKIRTFFLPDAFVQSQYQLMKDVHDVLEQSGVPYFIESGTLLGAVRHGEIIPWDDDMDIGVRKEDLGKLEKKALPLIKKRGYTVSFSGDAFQRPVKTLEAAEWYGYQIHSPSCHLDIFIYKSKKNGVMRYVTEDFCAHQFFYEKEIYPLKRYPLGPLSVWGPQNPKPYLDRSYAHWNNKGVFDGWHGYPVLPKIVVDFNKAPDLKKHRHTQNISVK